MLKKVSKLSMLFCMLALAGSVFAQKEVPEYPQYGFWSNWSIGATISFDYQPDVKQFYGVEKPFWGGGFNAGTGIVLQKEVDRGAYLRFRYNHSTWFTSCNKGPHENQTAAASRLRVDDNTITMDRHGAITGEFLLSLNNSFHNWDPECRWNFYIFGGGGVASSYNNATFGYLFNLGVTAADKELIAQRALLTKENFDALTAENEAVKDELAQAKNNEKKLRDQIEKLSAQTNNVNQEELARAQRVSDSLNNVLGKLKADQLSYYAIPFSVLYANDDWHVSSAEMIKVKAISRVMKDNPDLKLTIVGFCDYTGSDAYNWKLSQRRAEEVKRLMVKKYGIDEDRLTVDYKGKTVAFGDINYSLNRRVSFYRVIE